MNFKQKINKAIRDANFQSQKEVAEKLNIAESTISTWKSRGKLTAEFANFCELVGKPVEYFTDDSQGITYNKDYLAEIVEEKTKEYENNALDRIQLQIDELKHRVECLYKILGEKIHIEDNKKGEKCG